MTIERRLAKVEGSLTPTELVLRWLDEAHAHDDMESYMRFLIEGGPDALPMDRLAHEAEENARIRLKGKPRDEIETGVRRSMTEAVFLGQLVLRINVMSAEFLDREQLIQAALGAHLGLAVSGGNDRFESGPLERIVQNRNLLFVRVNELHAFETARTIVEGRYLAGAPADFPAARRAWAEQQTASETMTLIALQIAEFDGAPPRPSDEQTVFDARVRTLVGDFVEPAKSKAYDELGDGRRAMSFAMAWLRPKLIGGDGRALG